MLKKKKKEKKKKREKKKKKKLKGGKKKEEICPPGKKKKSTKTRLKIFFPFYHIQGLRSPKLPLLHSVKKISENSDFFVLLET